MKKRLPHWSSLVLGLSLLCVTLRALEKLLSTYTGDFHQDPIKHNVYAYTAHDFVGMLHQIKGLFQPALDFALRRYCLFPIFGFDERTFRIPGAICFLLSLWVVPFAIHTFLKRQGHPPAAAIIGAIGAAFWLLGNKILLTHGVEGRHYMAAALVSMAWFSCVFLFESKPRWAFFALSLLFANTHLFSFPVLATAFGLEAIHSCRERNWADVRKIILAGFAILALTVAINYPAFTSLLERPPAAKAHSLWSTLPEVEKLWRRFLELLALPLEWVLPLGIAGALLARRRAGFLLVFGVVFPLFLGYMRSKSNYPFHDRYFLPFFGFGAVSIAYGADALLKASHSLGKLIRLPRPELLSSGALLVAVAWTFPAKDLRGTFSELNRIRIPERYFSDGYKYYKQIRELPASKLVIYKYERPNLKGERHVPNYYLIVDRPPEEPPVELVSVRAKSLANNKAQIRAFWTEHAEATVVLDLPKRCKAKHSTIGRIIKSKKRCSVVVPGVKNLEEFNALMLKLGEKVKG